MKGNNFCQFLIAFLNKVDLSKMGATLKRKNMLLNVQLHSLESWSPIEKRDKKENSGVACPDGVPNIRSIQYMQMNGFFSA